eukprot:c10099_g1_i1.p1 GENE.c10099_g1_i1~~c10099_g1_i1.p1  ORF type:complete len:380 (-),score=159.79 c10099_g1_i1:25-1143(-)
MIRVTLIGAGQMGTEHLRNLALVENVTVNFICDPNEKSRENIESLKISGVVKENVKLFGDYHEILVTPFIDEIDAFLIASPNFTHFSILKELIPYNKHILVEKPVCTKIEDCKTIQELANKSTAVIWVGMEYRYMKPIAKLIEEVDKGTVGNLRMLSIREHRYPFLVKVENWNRFSENTGGTMVEKCCHFFDLMRRITKLEPISVYCNGGQDVNHLNEDYNGKTPDIIDNSYTIVEFENGVRACLDLCMFAENSKNQEEISVCGSHAKIEALIPESVVYIGKRDLITPISSLPPKHEKHLEQVKLPVSQSLKDIGYHEGSTYFELCGFFDAIRTKKNPEVGVVDGVKAVMMGIAAEISAKEKRVVRMSEFGF